MEAKLLRVHVEFSLSSPEPAYANHTAVFSYQHPVHGRTTLKLLLADSVDHKIHLTALVLETERAVQTMTRTAEAGAVYHEVSTTATTPLR